MHELGVLRQIVKVVNGAMIQNHIPRIKHITLEVGESSGIVPAYMRKLFPIAVDGYPALQQAELRIFIVRDAGLVIKEIGY